MSCTITLNIGSNKITLDGIEEDSIQSFYDYSNLIQEINKQGKTEEFINAIRAQGINNTSIYVNKDMEGLTDSKQFFLPNMTYREFRNKFPTAPELENINVLYEKYVLLLQFVLVVPNNVPCERIFGLVTTCTAHFF